MPSGGGKKQWYYAVKSPAESRGIYLDWPSCENVVIGVAGARYKKFPTLREAEEFVGPGLPYCSASPLAGPGTDTSTFPSSSGRGEAGTGKKRSLDWEAPASSSSSSKAARQTYSEAHHHHQDDEDEAEEDDYDYDENTVSMYYDGASRGNPGLAGCGAVMYNKDNQKIWSDYSFVGRQETNNVAEYSGLCLGLEAALKRGVRSIRVYGDSELVAKQMTGQYQVKAPHLQHHFKKATKLADQFDRFEIHNVPRAENSLADSLANEAINRHAYARPPGQHYAILYKR